MPRQGAERLIQQQRMTFKGVEAGFVPFGRRTPGLAGVPKRSADSGVTPGQASAGGQQPAGGQEVGRRHFPATIGRAAPIARRGNRRDRRRRSTGQGCPAEANSCGAGVCPNLVQRCTETGKILVVNLVGFAYVLRNCTGFGARANRFCPHQMQIRQEKQKQ